MWLKRLGYTLLTLFMVSILSYAYLKYTGKDQHLLVAAASYLLKPQTSFEPTNMLNKPDYAEPRFWLSLPSRTDEADLVPTSMPSSINNGQAPADVFYIHGTGFLNNSAWTSPIAPDSATEDNAKFSLANEASIFNACCNIYAPHYRETSMFSYTAVSIAEREIILDEVYKDISAAFDYYLQHYNQGRPIVIVSHSQGTHHAMRLIKEIDNHPVVAQQVVVGYLIGSGPISLTENDINSLTSFTVCQHAEQTHCIVHWDTYGKGGKEKLFASPEQSICVNPLTWTTDEELAPATLHQGAVAISGAYTMKIVGDDDSDGVIFNPPSQPQKEYTWAQCQAGFLYVADQSGSDYEKLGSLPDKSYHGIDFPLFNINIRNNVKQRIEQYLN